MLLLQAMKYDRHLCTVGLYKRFHRLILQCYFDQQVRVNDTDVFRECNVQKSRCNIINSYFYLSSPALWGCMYSLVTQ